MDWRIFADFAQMLVGTGMRTIRSASIWMSALYALGSTTIDLCLALFPWTGFRHHKAAVKGFPQRDLPQEAKQVIVFGL